MAKAVVDQIHQTIALIGVVTCVTIATLVVYRSGMRMEIWLKVLGALATLLALYFGHQAVETLRTLS